MNPVNPALESGRICAVAGQSQRQMRGWAAAYPALYGADAFDPALFSTLSLAAAFSGPWHGAEELRMANRACLWCFGLDWLIDYAATTKAQVDDLVAACKAVAASEPVPERTGPEPEFHAAEAELLGFLADVRDELAAFPAFPALRGIWLDELARTLDAMAREWSWKTREHRPTFEQYLNNADNLGFSFVLAAHWIATGTPAADQEVRDASWAVQRVVRLLNDLATYERDLKWGDLNALLLGVSREEVQERIARLSERSRDLLRPLRTLQPRLAGYMERQMDFCAGFYGITDYWGAT